MSVKVLLGKGPGHYEFARESLPYTPPKRFPDEFALTRLSHLRWTVTHVPTGLKVHDGYYKTAKAAAKAASKKLRRVGVENFRKAVTRATRRYAHRLLSECAPTFVYDAATRPGASTTAGSVPSNTSEPAPGLSKEDV